jgi:hypothetical protein
VLETSYIVHLLQPHHRNLGKRLVKTPKLYFLDPWLAAWLLGIQNPARLATHPQRGALFETWVVSELLKAATSGRAAPGRRSYPGTASASWPRWPPVRRACLADPAVRRARALVAPCEGLPSLCPGIPQDVSVS